MEYSLAIPIVALIISALLSCGGIYVLLKQTVYIDSKTGNISEIEIPLVGKLRTNYPSLIAVVCGFALASQVVYNPPEPAPMEITANVKVRALSEPYSRSVYARVIPKIYKEEEKDDVGEEKTVIFKFLVDDVKKYDVLVFSPSLSGEDSYTIDFGGVSFDNTTKKGVFAGELVLK